MYQSVLYFLQAYLPIHMLDAVMSGEKNGSYKGLTEARRRANKKYNDRFVEIKVRVTPEKRAIIKDHAEKMGESATAFINRAIDEAMKRDQESNPET